MKMSPFGGVGIDGVAGAVRVIRLPGVAGPGTNSRRDDLAAVVIPTIVAKPHW